MARITDYNSYFRYQAEQHPSLLHQEASGEQVFAIIPFESAYGQYRTSTREKSFMMRLLSYTFGIIDGSDQSRKAMVGGFIISKWHGNTTSNITEAVSLAINESEQVAEDIIAKMVRDSQNGHPLFDFASEEVGDLELNAQPLYFTGDGSYSGWLVTFKVYNYFDECDSTRSAVVWPDGGLTPLT